MNVILTRELQPALDLERAGMMWPRPATWGLIRRSEEAGGPAAFVTCSSCEKSASLSGHKIDADGKVTPSLACPEPGCDWHVFVTLEGWAEAIAA